MQTPVDGTRAEIVAAFERAVVPEAELYEGRRRRRRWPPRGGRRGPRAPDDAGQRHVGPRAGAAAGGTAGAATVGRQRHGMVDPLANTLVDAPVASTPVNEAVVAAVATAPRLTAVAAGPGAATAAAAAAAAAAAVAAAGAADPSTAEWWSVLGQWAVRPLL